MIDSLYVDKSMNQISRIFLIVATKWNPSNINCSENCFQYNCKVIGFSNSNKQAFDI